jgi:hypothetical protein
MDSLFTYSSWTLRGRYVVSIVNILLLAVVLCLLVKNVVPALLVLVPVFYAWVWTWRSRRVPRRIGIGESQVTFFFGGHEQVWEVKSVRFVDFRPGDLARPLGRVATFVRDDGVVLLADGEVVEGEDRLADALRSHGIDVRRE